MEKFKFFTKTRIIIYSLYFLILLVITILNYQFNKKPLILEANEFFENILVPYNYSKVEDSAYDIEYEKGNWKLGSHISCSIDYKPQKYIIDYCSLDFDEYDDSIFDIVDKINPENELRQFQGDLKKIIENKEYENLGDEYISLDHLETSESISVFKEDYNQTKYRILIHF